MSQDDIRYEAEELKGEAKETVGDRTDQDNLESEGKADQTTAANVNKAGEKAEDAVRDVRDGVREAYESGS